MARQPGAKKAVLVLASMGCREHSTSGILGNGFLRIEAKPDQFELGFATEGGPIGPGPIGHPGLTLSICPQGCQELLRKILNEMGNKIAA